MKKKKDAPFEKQKGCGTPLSLPDGKISEWYTPDVGKVSRNSQGESVAHPPGFKGAQQFFRLRVPCNK
jgi:hypothetical protein